MFLTCLCTYFIVHAFMKTSSLKKKFVLQSLLLKKIKLSYNVYIYVLCGAVSHNHIVQILASSRISA